MSFKKSSKKNREHRSTGYAPRDIFVPVHKNHSRFKVIVAHRRAGKTVFSINDLIDNLYTHALKNPQGIYIAPTYARAKRVSWDYFKDFTRVFPGVKFYENELKVVIPRRDDKVTIYLLGADNPDVVTGMYVDDSVVDEVGEMRPEVWTRALRPALSDRKGKATFIGTPRGKNFFYDMYKLAEKDPTWGSWMFRASHTGILDQAELDEAKNSMGLDEYDQEYECNFFAALKGAYYKVQMARAQANDHIVSVPWEPNIGVITSWDLGIHDTTVIWFAQVVGKEIRLIDYYENEGQGLDHYVKIIRDKPYIYDHHFFPHDISVRELSTGKSRLDTLISLGLRRDTIEVVPRTKSLEDDIDTVRSFLSKCYFDESKCDRGVEALKGYQRRWDSKLGTYVNKPMHDWASHGADSFRMLAVGFQDRRHGSNAKRYPKRMPGKGKTWDIFKV